MSRKNEGLKSLTVVQDKEERVPNQVLATEIVSIAAGVRSLLSGGLNEDAVVVLVTNAIPKSYGISEKTVRTVIFAGLVGLEKKYLKNSGHCG